MHDLSFKLFGAKLQNKTDKTKQNGRKLIDFFLKAKKNEFMMFVSSFFRNFAPLLLI